MLSYVLGLYVCQELCIVANRNDINFRSGCCDTRQKYILDIGSREREHAVGNVNYQDVLTKFDSHTFPRHRSRQ